MDARLVGNRYLRDRSGFRTTAWCCTNICVPGNVALVVSCFALCGEPTNRVAGVGNQPAPARERATFASSALRRGAGCGLRASKRSLTTRQEDLPVPCRGYKRAQYSLPKRVRRAQRRPASSTRGLPAPVWLGLHVPCDFSYLSCASTVFPACL